MSKEMCLADDGATYTKNDSVYYTRAKKGTQIGGYPRKACTEEQRQVYTKI